LGDVEDLSNLIDLHQIHIVFVTLSVFDEKFRGKEYLRICNNKGIRLRFIPEKERLYKTSNSMEDSANLSFINPQEIPLDDAKARLLKRTFDILFSSFVIVFLLSWLFPIVALLIKLSSKGPVFFIQKRTCLNNRIFNCYKFRSMKVNDLSDIQQATDYDNRITKLGQILRKTNIDELPQFFNVLMGHMSISGPRPHMLKHTQIYSELIDYYQVRHHVKPGITGWAQVNGYRGETDELWKMERRVEYDLDYIENWNFWWDIKIIALTVTNMKYFLPKMPESQRMSSYDCSGWQLRKLND
jgi:exopolysaccharide biosynthesis polyprenyl glycosylphosphotransferase